MQQSSSSSQSSSESAAPQLTPRQRFDRWLEQRSLDLQLRDSPDDSDSSEDEFTQWPVFAQEPAGPVAAWSPLPVQAGEVRLLDASLTPQTHDPIFVAIIELNAEEGMATLVSVSPYLDAATLFEFNLQHPQRYLNVLQVWNLRRLPLVVLKKSWRVAKLHLDDLAVANSVAAACLAGVTPPDSVLEFCGSPVRHPDDPRRAYLEEQADTLDHLQSLGATEYYAEENPVDEAATKWTRLPATQVWAARQTLPESPPKKNLWGRIKSRFGGPSPVDQADCALAAGTPSPPDLIGTLGEGKQYDYIITYGDNGCAIVKLMSALRQNEPVDVYIGDEIITLCFEWEESFAFASTQTHVAFSSDLKLRLAGQ